MCLYPKFIINRKYVPNKKNKYNPPQIKDERTKYVPVGCGNCMECKKQKSRGWQVRLHEEIRYDNKCIFVTLSFSDEQLTKLDNEIPQNYKAYYRDNKIATLAVRRFLELWRFKYGKSIKHWLVTELGQNKTERLHIHGILWTTNKTQLNDTWKYGNIWTGTYVNEKTINYIVKYINKIDQKHLYYNSIILSSKGIGKNYISRLDSKNNKFKGSNTDQLYTTRTGIKLNLPIYYRNLLYNDDQREELWLHLLNTNTRYVNKIKIDVSQNDDDYYKVLEDQRVINKILKYGDNIKDPERLEYEKHLRELKRLNRLQKIYKQKNDTS